MDIALLNDITGAILTSTPLCYELHRDMAILRQACGLIPSVLFIF